MNNLNDDELMRVAMGDLDDKPSPPEPKPQQHPQPPIPPNKNSSKLPIIVSVVIIILAIIVGIGIHYIKNNPENDNSDYNGYTDYSEPIMDDNSESAIDKVTIDPFSFINNIVVDTSNNDYWFNVNQKYHETINGVDVAFSGADKTFYNSEDNSFGLQFTAANGEQLGPFQYSCDISNYMETGIVTVTIETDIDLLESNGIYIESTTFEANTIECHYVKDASEVSDADFNTMKEYADLDYLSQNSEAKYFGTYFGYNSSGDSTTGDGDMFTREIGEKAFNVLKFTYVDNGYYECDTLYNLKITDDGRICNLEEVENQISYSFTYESVSELENTLNEVWPTMYKVD